MNCKINLIKRNVWQSSKLGIKISINFDNLAETTRLKHYFNIQPLADDKLINKN